MKVEKTRFCVFFAALALGASGFAADREGNGDGPAEQNAAFAALNLVSYIDACLASQVCGATQEEQGLLRGIRAEVLEFPPATRIEFKSEAAEPGFFDTGEPSRIAKTGSALGDAIFFNRDLMYPRDPIGRIVPMDIPALVGILVHELGHHQGIQDEESLDSLGAKVRGFLLGDFFQVSNFTVVNRFGTWPSAQVLMRDSFSMTDQSPRLFEEISSQHPCVSGELEGELKGFQFLNVHSIRGSQWEVGMREYWIWIQGDLSAACEGTPAGFPGVIVQWGGNQFRLGFKMEVSSDDGSNGGFNLRYTGERKIEVFPCGALLGSFVDSRCH